MLLIVAVNGALRQIVFAKHLTDAQTHQLSTLTGALAIGARQSGWESRAGGRSLRFLCSADRMSCGQ